jgi:hypothetical protein
MHCRFQHMFSTPVWRRGKFPAFSRTRSRTPLTVSSDHRLEYNLCDYRGNNVTRGHYTTGATLKLIINPLGTCTRLGYHDGAWHGHWQYYFISGSSPKKCRKMSKDALVIYLSKKLKSPRCQNYVPFWSLFFCSGTLLIRTNRTHLIIASSRSTLQDPAFWQPIPVLDISPQLFHTNIFGLIYPFGTNGRHASEFLSIPFKQSSALS